VWQAVRERLHPQGLEIVTVALDSEGPEAARPFVESAKAEHPSLIDESHRVDELFGVVNVPNGVWIDEAGMIVRPAEPAFPGRNPVMETFEQMDPSTLPPELAEVIIEAKKIKTDPEGYLAMVEDWVAKGEASTFALARDEVVARSQPRPANVAEAAARFELGEYLHKAGRIEAAQEHWRQAHRLQPDNWTYKRQAWNLVSPVVQGPTDIYDSSWFEDVKKIGAENYYPPVVP
jgi:hypothetical protein